MEVTDEKEIVLRTVRAYDDFVIGAYCRVRFIILHQRFLDEIGQYLPEKGTVLDIGCGFGLFALYFAQRHPQLHVHGIDMNERRIAHAREAAERLGVKNATFAVGDAKRFHWDGSLDGAYLLDILHHVSREAATRLIGEIALHLAPGARLLVKDVADRPWPKMAFTWLLDKLMSLRDPVDYWSTAALRELLRANGLITHCHAMVDLLPYPHVLFIAQKPGAHDVEG
jgi:2-polyprenyl-3-methyl-5-hydroxy-6-metoxy-1,4-benzoquinol methylase